MKKRCLCEIDGAVLGFDFGLRHIGVAVGQTITNTATPLSTIRADRGVPNWDDITGLVKQWQPQAMIVGVPFNMDGSEQPITSEARTFAYRLHERYKLTVYLSDERLTTKAARTEIFQHGGYAALKKTEIDSVAAVLIVEGWLSSRGEE